MEHQALFSSKDKSTKIKVSSAANLFGAIRVKRNQLLQLCTARTVWSDAAIRPARFGPFR